MQTKEILARFSNHPDKLLMILHEIQDNNPENYITEEDIAAIAGHLNLTLAQVFGTISYYSMFSTKPRGKHIIRICRSPVCSMSGARNISEEIQKEIGKNSNFSIETCECLGNCDHAPSLLIDRQQYGDLSVEKIKGILDKHPAR
ncbi:MAG: NAD(P)H-dependent oxidoreductase subunit E [Bacteroidota bacterium]